VRGAATAAVGGSSERALTNARVQSSMRSCGRRACGSRTWRATATACSEPFAIKWR
jgi:hypothetical protein